MAAGSKQHIDSGKPYCAILGRNYCSICNEGQLREASFVNSIAYAEDFIKLQREAENNLPYSSLCSHKRSTLLESRLKDGWISRQAHFPVDDTKIDKLVHSVFPIIYKSMSANSCGKPKDREISHEFNRGVFFTTNRKMSTESSTPPSLLDSLASGICTSKRNSFEESGGLGCKYFARRQRLSSQYAIKGVSAKEDDSWEYIRNGQTTTGERSDQMIDDVPWAVKSAGEASALNSEITTEMPDNANYQNSRKSTNISGRVDKQDDGNQKILPGRTFQRQVRRSSLAGVTVRTLSFERLRVQIENWKPSLLVAYPRFSESVSLKDYKTRVLRNPRVHGELHPTNSDKPLLQLPIEPVICKIKYMRNRWKDEALCNGNLFAVKLDA